MTSTIVRQRHQAHPPATSFTVPPSQNTAPVHEFRCLWTADLKRKAKRWQDGFLRVHTFNKRAMVYDDQRNFIGDTHLPDISVEVQDGDEFDLERSGKMVQVGERLGVTETDLSELLAKRVAKPIEKEPRPRSMNVVRTEQPPRPLHTAPQTPMRWTGRAQLPQESPYEIRQAQNMQEQEPPSKRLRRDDEHLALWDVIKTTTAKSSRTKAAARPVLPPSFGLHNKNAAGNSASRARNRTDVDKQSRLKVKQVVDLTISSSVDTSQQDAPSVGGRQTDHSRPRTTNPDPMPLARRERIPLDSIDISTDSLPSRQEKERQQTESIVIDPDEDDEVQGRTSAPVHEAQNGVRAVSPTPGREIVEVVPRARPKAAKARPRHQESSNPPDRRSQQSTPVAQPQTLTSPPSRSLLPSSPRTRPVDQRSPPRSPSSPSMRLTPEPDVIQPQKTHRKAQPLRMTARGARKTLLCQTIAQARSSAASAGPATASRASTPPSPKAPVRERQAKKKSKQRAPTKSPSPPPEPVPPTRAAARRQAQNGHETAATEKLSITTEPIKAQQPIETHEVPAKPSIPSPLPVTAEESPITAHVQDDAPHEPQTNNTNNEVPSDHNLDTALNQISPEPPPLAPVQPFKPPLQPTTKPAQPPPPTISAFKLNPAPRPLTTTTTTTTTLLPTPPIQRPFQPLHINPAAAAAHHAATIPPAKESAGARTRSRSRADRAAQALAEESVAGPTSTAGTGPWSREAWDLFGWAPAGRGRGWPELAAAVEEEGKEGDGAEME